MCEVGFFLRLMQITQLNVNNCNYGNSVRFLAKIPNSTAAERRATVYIGTQLIPVGCIRQKKSQCGPCQPSRFLPASPAFLREMSL